MRNPTIRFRRMMDTRFDGSAGPREPMSYRITVWGRGNRRIMGVIVSWSLKEAFEIARLMLGRYPARMVSVSRTIQNGNRRTEPLRAAFAVPDYKAFRILTPHERVKRGVWRVVRDRSDVMAALRSNGRLHQTPHTSQDLRIAA
jgi:hypothetical protein